MRARARDKAGPRGVLAWMTRHCRGGRVPHTDTGAHVAGARHAREFIRANRFTLSLSFPLSYIHIYWGPISSHRSSRIYIHISIYARVCAPTHTHTWTALGQSSCAGRLAAAYTTQLLAWHAVKSFTQSFSYINAELARSRSCGGAAHQYCGAGRGRGITERERESFALYRERSPRGTPCMHERERESIALPC